jgi:sugar phosphate isomerase/epimerase
MTSFAINTYSYIWRFSARECLEHLAARGHTAFEILVNPPHLWPGQLTAAERKEMAALLDQRNLRILSLNPPSLDLNLVSPSREMRAYSIAHYRDVIELAGEWRAPWVVVGPGKTHPLLPAPRKHVMGWFNEALEQMSEAAEKAGVELLLENLPMSFLPRADDLMDLLGQFGGAPLGIVYDVANAVFAREPPGEGLRRVKERLRLVHLSDTGLEQWNHSQPGLGVVPFREVAETLAEMGYRNPCVLEVISENPDEELPAALQALSQYSWGEEGGGTAGG